MAQRHSCPVCGTPISETRYAEIEAQIRAEERANYEKNQIAFEVDAEKRRSEAVADAIHKTEILHQEALALQAVEARTLNDQIKAAELREKEIHRKHATDLETKVAEVKKVSEVEAAAKIAASEGREREAQAKLVAAQTREQALISEHQSALKAGLAAAEEALRAQFVDELANLKNQDAKQAETIRRLQKDQELAAAESARNLAALSAGHLDEIKRVAADNERMGRQAAAAQLSAISEERNSMSVRIAQLEAQSTTAAQAHEANLKLVLADVERAHSEELVKQRAILDTAKAEELGKFRTEVATQQESLRKKLQEAERKLEQKTAHELGHWPEVNLVKALREAFPNDDVKPVAKGVAGADIIYTVRYKGEECGRIVIDSKNRQQWRESFVEKLSQDQLNAEAQHAVLSTAVFPQGTNDLSVRKDVILAKPNQVVSLIDLLRRMMISSHILGLSRADEGRKKDRLYQLITSELYRQLFTNAEKICRQLQQLDTDEYAAHQKTWENRGKMQRQLDKILREMNSSMAAIVEGSEAIDILQIPDQGPQANANGKASARLSGTR